MVRQQCTALTTIAMIDGNAMTASKAAMYFKVCDHEVGDTFGSCSLVGGGMVVATGFVLRKHQLHLLRVSMFPITLKIINLTEIDAP